IMQYGGGGANHNPWDFTVYDASAFTEETLALFKRYATLHTRLFPLFWELAQASGTAGTPGILPVGLAYPDESFSSDTAFMIGSTLLVQPVEQAGVTTMDVELPAGDWVHWWSGQRYAGGTVNVPAPVGEGPLFQRAGTAVPMLRRSIQTLSPSDGSVDSWADDPGILSVRVVQDGTALEAMSLESGEQVAAAGGGLELSAGSRYTGWDLEIYTTGVSSVTMGGQAVAGGSEGCGSCWWQEGPWLRVELPAGSGTLSYQ
ncbi:MAG TPA: glycoside hydrolase family 31 protein, partial [Myxococcota bacterium]|nr:glycoside hydrolase family 31 protein [Myxococcota bacterium]